MGNFLSSSSQLVIPKRLFSTSGASSSLPFTAHYLVNTCGMPLESAISAAKRVQIRENKTKNADAVLGLMKSYGFEDTHLASLIARRPRLLLCRPQTTLKPKIDFLIETGYRGSLLHELIVRNPDVLSWGVKTYLEPIFDLLRTYIPNFEKLNSTIRRTGWILSSRHALKPNIEFLSREGVTHDRLSKFITSHPRAALQSHKRVVRVVEKVKQMGLEPESTMFVHAVRVMLSMTDAKWNHKVELLKSLGWSEEDVLSAFQQEPSCLSVSEDKILRVMDFYLNTMKMDLEMIGRYPKFLSFGLTRLHRRHRVLEFLISKGLLKRDKLNGWLLSLSEENFLRRCIVKNLGEVPDLMEIYRGSSDKDNGKKKKKKQEKSV